MDNELESIVIVLIQFSCKRGTHFIYLLLNIDVFGICHLYNYRKPPYNSYINSLNMQPIK
jgi:hypothetical protein